MLILQLKNTASPFICLLFELRRFCRGLIRLRIVQSVSKDISFKSSKKGSLLYYVSSPEGGNKSFIIGLLAQSVRTHHAIGPSMWDKTSGWRAKQLCVGELLQHRPWVWFKLRSNAGRDGQPAACAERPRPGRAPRVPGDVVCRRRERIEDPRSRTSRIRAAGWQLLGVTWSLSLSVRLSVCLSAHWVFTLPHSLKLDGEPASLTSNRAVFFFLPREV